MGRRSSRTADRAPREPCRQQSSARHPGLNPHPGHRLDINHVPEASSDTDFVHQLLWNVVRPIVVQGPVAGSEAVQDGGEIWRICAAPRFDKSNDYILGTAVYSYLTRTKGKGVPEVSDT